MDEVVKLMWHNMIDHLRRIFLESWFSNHQKKYYFNFYDPKICHIILLCKVVFKYIPIKMPWVGPNTIIRSTKCVTIILFSMFLSGKTLS